MSISYTFAVLNLIIDDILKSGKTPYLIRDRDGFSVESK